MQIIVENINSNVAGKVYDLLREPRKELQLFASVYVLL